MMILPTSDDIRATLRDHLTQLIDRAAFDPELAEAVASAVVTYLDEQGLAPPLPDDYLHLAIPGRQRHWQVTVTINHAAPTTIAPCTRPAICRGTF